MRFTAATHQLHPLLRAGSGTCWEFNAPNAMFTSVVNPASTSTVGFQRLSNGFPTGLATVFSAGHRQLDYIPKDTKDAMPRVLPERPEDPWAKKNVTRCIAYVGNHGVICRALSTPTRRTLRSASLAAFRRTAGLVP